MRRRGGVGFSSIVVRSPWCMWCAGAVFILVEGAETPPSLFEFRPDFFGHFGAACYDILSSFYFFSKDDGYV